MEDARITVKGDFVGLRGKAPTPSNILKLTGSRMRRVEPNEPQPEPGPPPMPKGMPRAAKVVWKILCRQLDEMSVVTEIDWAALERYCRYFVRWRECEDFIARNGISFAVKSDNPHFYVGKPEGGGAVIGWKEFPQVKESHRLNEALGKIEVQFGLTPSARTRIRAIAEQGPEESAVPKRKRV